MTGIRWPEVIASAVCVAGLCLVALYFHSYEPKAFSAADEAASRRRALANCGYGMFDVEPHGTQCAAFDAISIQTPGYTMTIRNQGPAELRVVGPAQERGRFEATIPKSEFRRLANLLAMLALDRRGNLAPPAEGGDATLRAGCGGTWSVHANQGGEDHEVPGFAMCLDEVKTTTSWDRIGVKAD